MEVSTACEGLPLVLVTVATALKNKRFPEWEDALQQLKSPNSEGVMYSAIELSYNYLESQELRPFFLLCAQIGSGIYYQDFVKKNVLGCVYFMASIHWKNQEIEYILCFVASKTLAYC